MGKIKVLHAVMANGKGGITQAVLENWRLIDKERITFEFLTLEEKLDCETEIVQQGGKVHYVTCRAEQDSEKFIEEIDKIFEQGFDIVHLHTSVWKGTLLEDRARAKGIKRIIIQAHNTGLSRMEDVSAMEAMRERHCEIRDTLSPATATDFWACSWPAAEWIFGKKIPAERIRIVRDAIDTERFAYREELRMEYRRRYGLDNKFVIGHIGRFAYQKNQEFLVELLPEVRKRRPDAVLLFEGVGKTKHKISERIKELGLEQSVLFFEQYERIEELYQIMDVFAFPSRFEGFGRVLLEAQCTGLKCIASELIPEDVKVTGLLTFEKLEKERWVDWLAGMEAYKRCTMADAVRQAGYDLRTNVRELEKLYERG